MTSEIAIMNTLGIAMAADSALTIGGRKTFMTSNKIFTLSKYEPVGIMIYGNAQFMSLPWELLIKLFRDELRDKNFKSLKEYRDNFIGFLNKCDQYFDDSTKTDFLKAIVWINLRGVFDILDNIFVAQFEENEELDHEQVEGLITSELDEAILRYDEDEYFENMDEKFKNLVLETYGDIFDSLLSEFPDVNSFYSREEIKNRIQKLMVLICVKKESINNDIHSGIVIAGYGSKDVFPRLYSFITDGMILNKMRVEQIRDAEISWKNSARISSFAQAEMIASFMNGIDPRYELKMMQELVILNEKITKTVGSEIANKFEIDQQQVIDIVSNQIEIKTKEFIEEINDFSEMEFQQKVLDIVTALQKEELAEMAETLVNLTSFKQKVSEELPTVGGPIDVAIITKGDGFVWVNRKHYFKPELNPHYFKKYLKK